MEGFIGRQNEVQLLEAKLFQPNGSRRVAVVGLGGVGKSRLALELAHRAESQLERRSIFWVRATDALTFEKDFFEIGKKLKIPGIEDEKADYKGLVTQVLSQDSGDWLMILDEADDEAIWGRSLIQNTGTMTLTKYLPKSATGSILITTRNRRVATTLAGKQIVTLEEMNIDEAIQLLGNLLTGPEILEDHIATSTLLQRLTCLPLAIVQAAAYINMNDVTIQVYLDLLEDGEENTIDLLDEDFEDEGRYKERPNAVASTWLISFEQIRRQDHLATDYLSFMACLSEKNIPQSLLPQAPSMKKMVDALGILTGYSFVRKQSDSNTTDPLYDMHRLVHLATRKWLRIENSLLDRTTTTMERLAKLFPTRQHINKDKWMLYMPHAQTLCDFDVGRELDDRYNLLEKMGLCLMADGKYNEAVAAHSSVVLWRDGKFGIEDERTLDAHNHLGEALRELGK